MQNSEAAEPQEVPKNHQTLWVLSTHRMGNECPLFGLSMPDTCKRLRIYTLPFIVKVLTFAP